MPSRFCIAIWTKLYLMFILARTRHGRRRVKVGNLTVQQLRTRLWCLAWLAVCEEWGISRKGQYGHSGPCCRRAKMEVGIGRVVLTDQIHRIHLPNRHRYSSCLHIPLLIRMTRLLLSMK
ncbi:hypothetical protein EDC04DRAFT_1067285 [Pisolithus marmoratus]|nr:hypothetical protein EDC04DRAFT_1067285 [Pisolithus marmoratus]